jgi:hypothetical protein
MSGHHLARVLTSPGAGLSYGGIVQHHDRADLSMPRPRGLMVSPYQRAVMLAARLPASPEREEVEAMLSRLDRWLDLSPAELERLSQLESAPLAIAVVGLFARLFREVES